MNNLHLVNNYSKCKKLLLNLSLVEFLACNHVTRWPCWWCVGGQYNTIFSRRIYMNIGFSSQRREMLLFLTLTHHQHGRHDVTQKPAMKPLVHFFEMIWIRNSDPRSLGSWFIWVAFLLAKLFWGFRQSRLFGFSC